MSDGESVEYRSIVTVDSKQAVAGLDQLEGASAKSDRGLKTLDSTARRTGGGLSTFGGVCRAAAAGLAFFGVSLGIGAILHKTLEEVKSGESAFAQLSAGVKSTGGAAGYSADQLAAYSQVLSRQTAIDDEVIQGAQRMLLTFTSIGHDVFPAATKAVMDISAVMGGDLQGAAIQVGKALQDPVRGMSALRRVGVDFSNAQEKVIKKLMATGQLAKAQGIILAELNKEFGGTAAAARNTLGGALETLGNRWGDLLQQMGNRGSGIFRDAIEGMIGLIERLTDGLANDIGDSLDIVGERIRSVAGPALAYLAEALTGTSHAGDFHALARDIGDVLGKALALASYSVGFLANHFGLLTTAAKGFLLLKVVDFLRGWITHITQAVAVQVSFAAQQIQAAQSQAAYNATMAQGTAGVATYNVEHLRSVGASTAVAAATQREIVVFVSLGVQMAALTTAGYAMQAMLLGSGEAMVIYGGAAARAGASVAMLTGRVVGLTGALEQQALLMGVVTGEQRLLSATAGQTTLLLTGEAAAATSAAAAFTGLTAAQKLNVAASAWLAKGWKDLRAVLGMPPQVAIGIAVVAIAMKLYIDKVEEAHRVMLAQLDLINSTRTSINTMKTATDAILDAKTKELKITHMLTDAEGELIVAHLARLTAARDAAQANLASKESELANTYDVMGAQFGGEATPKDVTDARGEFNSLDQQVNATLKSIDRYSKAIQGLRRPKQPGETAGDLSKEAASAEAAIKALERLAKLMKEMSDASAKGRAALADEEDRQRRLNAVYQIEAPLLAKGLSLTKEQTARIVEASDKLNTYTIRLKSNIATMDEVIDRRKELLALAGEQFDSAGSASFFSGQGAEKFSATIQGVLGFLESMVALEREARTEAEKRAQAYLEIAKLVAKGKISADTGARLQRQNANPLFSAAEEEWHAFAEDVAGSLVSQRQLYDGEIAKIQKAVKLEVMTVETGEEAIYRIRQQKMDDTLGYVTSGLNYMANLFGGFFAKLAALAQGIQGAVSFGKDVSDAASSMKASSQMASALGGIATVVAIFAVVYDFVDKMIKEKKAISYGADAKLTIASSDHSEGITAVSDQGLKVVQAIRDVVKQMENALGGTITDLQGLGVKIRNDGKYVASYINGVMVGHFESVDEAILAALQQALQTGQAKVAGVSDLVAQGIKEFNFTNAQGVQDFLTALREISNMSLSQGAIGLQDTIRHLGDLWDVLSKMQDVTPAVTEGFANLAAAEVQAWASWRDAITGRHRSVQEELEDHKREAGLFNAQRLLRLAELQMRRLELQQELALLKARGHLLGTRPRGDSPPGEEPTYGGRDPSAGGPQQLSTASSLVSAEMKLNKYQLQGEAAYLQVKTGLVSAELSMYDQTIALIELQLQAIDQIIANMPDAIDIPSIRLPGSGSSAGDDKKAFRERLADITAGGLGEAGKALYDYEKQLKDLAAEQKKNKAPAAEYQAALAEIRREFQKGLLDRAKDLAGVAGDDFTKSLEDGLKFFAELKKMGSAKSGISDALRDILEGKFLDKMKNDWQQRVNEFAGISDPMLAITIQAEQLGAELDALGKAGTMTAAEIAAAKALIAQGVDYQKQQGINGILDRLLAVVHESGKYHDLELSLAKAKVQIEYAVMREQLRAYGVLAQYAGLIDDAEKTALKLLAEGGLTSSSNQGRWWFEGNQVFADNLKAFQDAVAAFRKSTDALLTDSQLSDLSAEDRLAELRSKFDSLAARAQGGDTAAFAELEATRRELLQQGRTAYQGGAQYSALFKYVMDRSEGVLAGARAPSPMDAVVAAISGAEGTFALHLDNGTNRTVGAIADAAIKISEAVANENTRQRIGTLNGAGLTNGAGLRLVTAPDTSGPDTVAAISGLRAQLDAALVELRAIKADGVKTAKNTGDTASSTNNIDRRGKAKDLEPGRRRA